MRIELILKTKIRSRTEIISRAVIEKLFPEVKYH